ncbi:hypothetical protein [Salinispira pacifica]
MKKAILSLLILIVTASVLFSRSFAESGPAQARELQNRIESFYPRLEGSSGGLATIRFVESSLKEAGISYSTRSFSGFEASHSFSRVISVTIAGERPDTLIIAVPLNHSLYADRGDAGAAGIAAGIVLARALSEERPPLTVRILFLGADIPLLSDQQPLPGTGMRSYPLGSRLFLQNYFPESPVALLYLDIGSAGGSLAIRPGGGSLLAPAWLVRGAVEAAQEAGMDFTLSDNRILSFRLGRSEYWSPITPYLVQGIPALLLSTSEQDGRAQLLPDVAAPNEAAVAETSDSASIELWYRKLFALVDRFLSDHRSGLSTDWDHHYLIINAGGTVLFYGERATLAILMVVIGLTLAYGVARRRRLIRYARTVVRNFWNLPLLAGVVFLFLLASTLLVGGFLSLRDFPSLWEHYPILFFAWKIALSLFLSTLAFRLLRRLPVSRNGSFYSAAALFFLFLDVVISALINLSFVTYFLFAFVVCFLFTVTRIRWLKLLLLLASPLLLLKAAWDALTAPELQLVHDMLLSPVRGNLLLAFVTLPFLLMVIRMDFLVRHPVRGRTSFATLLAMAATGASTVVLALFLLTEHPFDSQSPQPVTVIQHVDADSGKETLTLTSPAPLGNLSFLYGDRDIALSNAGRSRTLSIGEGGHLLEVSRSVHAFLGREQTTLTVRPGAGLSRSMQLYRVAVALESPEPLVMYDSGFPFSYSDANRRVDLHIGVNPPSPLRVDYTLPAGKSPEAVVTAGFLNLPVPCLPRSANYAFNLRTEVTRVVAAAPGQRQ